MMRHNPRLPTRIFTGALHAAAAALLLFGHMERLWQALPLLGAFMLASLLQYELAGPGAARFAWAILAARAALAAGCLLLFGGPGAALLLLAVALDGCLLLPPLPAGLLCLAALGATLAFTPPSPEAWTPCAALYASVYFLARAARKESETGRSAAETAADLRVREKRLAEANERLRQTQEELGEAARLRERSRIARGIHDTLGHTLTAVIVQLSAALQVLDRDGDAARRNVSGARDQAKDALSRVRDTVHMLETSGLTFAEKLREAAGAAEAGLHVKVLTMLSDGLAPSAEAQQLLLSCLREGLTNGVRHGEATAFLLQVVGEGGALRLRLEDNGRGCETLQKGYGLTAMEETVEQCGGTLKAAGMEGGGFFLEVTLPCGTGE